MATKLEQYRDGKLVERKDFLPQHLKWAHRETPTIPVLPKGLFWTCVLGAVREEAKAVTEGPVRSKVTIPVQAGPDRITDIKGQDRYQLIIEVLEPHTSRYHVLPPGEYRLTVRVAAENHPTVETFFDLDFTGRWPEEEQDMAQEGLTVSKGPDNMLESHQGIVVKTRYGCQELDPIRKGLEMDRIVI